MGILDLLKRNRDDEDEAEDDEDLAGEDDEDEGDDEESGGLLGGLKRFGSGRAVRGLLTSWVHRGGDDEEDEDEDEDEDDDSFVPAATPATSAPGPATPLLEQDQDEEEVTVAANRVGLAEIRPGDAGADESDEAEVAGSGAAGFGIGVDMPSVGIGEELSEGNSGDAADDSENFSMANIFDGKGEVDEKLRDLAVSQEDLEAKDLLADLKSLLSDLEDLSRN